ncbi:MAG: HEAT repeat domain-containing protein [Candidatus Heimdallarchaeota archaeon]|nr:HEAT repeat domain-containing protein [Candidatus Heimdallarchaeota archaeon]MCK4770062.1 HEAT repeat domain-containing protein [Candidatus Heimdallarchaeota archaeon]
MSEHPEASDIEGLIKQLKYSSIPLQRERAAYILSNYRESIVLEALLNAQLTDPNPRVRDAASQALASLMTAEEIEEEDILEKLKKTQEGTDTEYRENIGGQLFNLSKDFEIIRNGMRKTKFDWKDSLELKQLFNSVEKDKYLPKQPNVKSIINSILLLPIDDSNMGRDVAIALSEILRVSSDEIERLNAIGCLNNIITNIDRYTPFFGIAEAYIMLFKASDESEMRIAAFKCLEEIIVKKKSLAKMNLYTNDIVKLLTFSYDQKIREIALFSYPDLVLIQEEKMPILVDLIIGIVRATYEDRLREMGLKALEAIIIKEILTEENVQRIVKILKSHQNKNVRIRAIELFTQIIHQTELEVVDPAISALTAIVLNTKVEDICYSAIQNIEKYAFSLKTKKRAEVIFSTMEDVTLKSHHPFLAFRAYSIIESVILNHPKKFTKKFASVFVECLKLHKDIGVMEQILLAYSELVTNRDLLPRDVKQFVKTILYLSDDPDVLEGLVNIFKELMLSSKEVMAEKIINRLMEIVGKTLVKDDIFLQLEELDENDFI